MAKILVADDNSNIQKMVGLALKDQGIDVVAVGNGEAAVRKISDVRPDLVLADVFMPVRNGYEVCQYVKGDSSLAHIPVILLVGAFDPLDEQEAQRVGADGVLKKPFVPPDPLISMVKSALARAGVSIGHAAPAPKEEPVHMAAMLTPKAPPAAIAMPPLEDFPSADAEPVQEGIPARPEPLQIDSSSQPVAFQNLLESPATEQADDADYAATARPELERDWKSGHDEEEEVEEEEEEQSASWRRDGGSEAVEEEVEASGAVKDWRETAFSDAPARKSRSEAWTPTKEISNFEEAAEAEPSVAATVTEMPVAETKVTPAQVTAFPADSWAAASGPKKPGAATAVEAAPAVAQVEEAPAEVRVEKPVPVPVNIAPAMEPERKPAADSWFSAVSSPWEADAQKGNQLASAWDAPATAAPPAIVEPEEPAAAEPPYDGGSGAKSDPSDTVDTLPPVLSEEVQAKVEEAAIPAATVDALREETHQITGTVILQAPPALAGRTEPKPAQPSMEDLVAKVLAQMSPDVLQAVTREILKPVVEAMVRDELNGKK